MITFKQFLNEKRRNPELNPVLSPIEQLETYKKDPNVYISYTEIDKIGINPRSVIKTPLGIYAYPLGDRFSSIEHNIRNVPRGGWRKYIFVIKRKNNIFIKNMKSYSNKDYIIDINKLRKYYSSVSNLEEIIVNSKIAYNKPIQDFWITTRTIAETLSGKTSINWASILKKLEYKGFNDDTDFGVIDPAEGKEIVFFDTKGFTVLDKIDTTIGLAGSNRSIDTAILKNPELILKLKNPSEKQVISFLKSSPVFGELEKVFQKIKNPSKKLQLAVVTQNEFAIKIFKNPSEEIQLIAITQNPRLIQDIKNPTEKVKRLANRRK